jgi:hypothetical protein
MSAGDVSAPEPDAEYLERDRRATAIADVVVAVVKGESIPAKVVQVLGGRIGPDVGEIILRVQKTITRMSTRPLPQEVAAEVAADLGYEEGWRSDPWETTMVFVPIPPRLPPAARTSRPHCRPRRRRRARARSPGRPARPARPARPLALEAAA